MNPWVITEPPQVDWKVGRLLYAEMVEHEVRIELISGPLTLSLSRGQCMGLRQALENAEKAALLIDRFLGCQGIDTEFKPTEKGGEPPGRAFTGDFRDGRREVVFWPASEKAPRILWLTPEELAHRFEMVTDG